MKQYWQMLINDEARWQAPGGSLYYHQYFYVCLKTYTKKSCCFLEKEWMVPRNRLFCSKTTVFPREFSFLNVVKSHRLPKVSDVLIQVSLSTCWDDSSSGPFCHPCPISLLWTDFVTSNYNVSAFPALPLLLSPSTLWAETSASPCLFPPLHFLGQAASDTLQHDSDGQPSSPFWLLQCCLKPQPLTLRLLHWPPSRSPSFELSPFCANSWIFQNSRLPYFMLLRGMAHFETHRFCPCPLNSPLRSSYGWAPSYYI